MPTLETQGRWKVTAGHGVLHLHMTGKGTENRVEKLSPAWLSSFSSIIPIRYCWVFNNPQCFPVPIFPSP